MAPPRYGTTSTGEPPPAKPPRYGTTSCALAKATGNTGRVVAVEPDPAAQAHLVANLRRNGCSVGVVRGTVGASSPLAFVPSWSYASYTRPAGPGESAVPNFGLAALEARLGARFDAVLLDCEGCIRAFFGGADGRALLAGEQLRLILMEEDGHPAQVKYYPTWYARLGRHGFRRVWQSHDTYNSSWSRTLVHSAWARGPLAPGSLTCLELAARDGLARHELACPRLSHTAPRSTKAARARGCRVAAWRPRGPSVMASVGHRGWRAGGLPSSCPPLVAGLPNVAGLR